MKKILAKILLISLLISTFTATPTVIAQDTSDIQVQNAISAPTIDGNLAEWTDVAKNYLTIYPSTVSTVDYFQMAWDGSAIYIAIQASDQGASNAGNNDWVRMAFDFDGKATTSGNILARPNAGIYAMNLSPWLPGGYENPVNFGGSSSSGSPVLKSFLFRHKYENGKMYYEAKCEPTDALKAKMVAEGKIGFSLQYDDNLVGGSRDNLYVWGDTDGVLDNDMSTLGQINLKSAVTQVNPDQVPVIKAMAAPSIDGNLGEWNDIPKDYFTIYPSTVSTTDYFQLTWDENYIYIALEATDVGASNGGNNDWVRMVFDFDGKATMPGDIVGRPNAGIYAMNLSPWMPMAGNVPYNYGGASASGYSVLKSLVFSSRYANGKMYYEAKCEPTDALKAKLIKDGSIGFSIQYDDNLVGGVRNNLYVWKDTDGVFDNDMSTLGDLVLKSNPKQVEVQKVSSAPVVNNLGKFTLNGNTQDTMYDWGFNIINENGIYKMWWTRGDPNDTIWYAESTDRINWVNARKVLTASNSTWEKFHVADPSVIHKDNMYYMFYESNYTIDTNSITSDSNIFLATSTDGVSWNKYPNNSNPLPVLKEPESVIGQGYYGVGMPSVLYKDNQFIMYYTFAADPLAGPTGGNVITRAVSTDGITWGGPSDTHQKLVVGAGAEVKFSQALNKYIMLYTANNQVGRANPPPDSEFNYGLHIVESADGITWPATTYWDMASDSNNIVLSEAKETRVFAGLITDGLGIVQGKTFYSMCTEGTIHTPTEDFKNYSSTWDGEMYSITLNEFTDEIKFRPSVDGNISEWSGVQKNYLTINPNTVSTTDYFQSMWNGKYIYLTMEATDAGASNSGNNDWLRLIFDFDGNSVNDVNISGRPNAGIYAMNLSPWLPGGYYNPVNYGGSASSGNAVLKNLTYNFKYENGKVIIEAKCEPTDALKAKLIETGKIGFALQYDDNFVSGVGRDHLYLWGDTDGVLDNQMNTLGQLVLGTTTDPVTFQDYIATQNQTIVNIQTNTSITDFKAALKPSTGADVQFVNAQNGKVGTGTTINIYKNGEIVKTYQAVIYGDLDGDGDIAIADLVLVKKHLLHIGSLNVNQLIAGDVNKQGTITVSDLIALKKHLLGISTISQS